MQGVLQIPILEIQKKLVFCLLECRSKNVIEFMTARTDTIF
jgi:hypothetical protein